MARPDDVTLSDLHAANIARQAEWCAGGDPEPDLAFRGNELAGETGEACNVIKKLERERHGWRGSRATKEQLAEELADVVICADLCAVTAGIDLGEAVAAKFNATSEKVGLTTKLAPAAEIWRPISDLAPQTKAMLGRWAMGARNEDGSAHWYWQQCSGRYFDHLGERHWCLDGHLFDSGPFYGEAPTHCIVIAPAPPRAPTPSPDPASGEAAV